MDYLRTTFMTLKIDGVPKVYGIDYTVNGQEMTIFVAPPDGSTIVIKRMTTTDRLVVWADASVLRASDMTLFEVQLLHLQEETSDAVQTDAADQALQAKLARDQAVDSATAALASQTDALVSKNSANASAIVATTQAGIATTQATSASASATIATTQATNLVVAVDNAKTSETNAKTSEINAKTSETNSKTSEVNAKSSEINAANSAAVAGGALWQSWTVAGRLSSPLNGFTGYNSDLAVIERWDGITWKRLVGGRRGDIKMWSGSVTDIEAGWVLADGVQRVHPEGGSFTPPNLKDRFIVGAGSSYAVGAVGGEDMHVLNQTEIPSHTHLASTDAQGAHAHNILVGGAANWGTASIRGGTDGSSSGPNTTTVGAHAHNVSVGWTGGGGAHENRPPYYALCYLYKI
jgi:microcystin-dependent protein